MLSQVVLSLALPIPMIALVLFTRRRDIMGEFANSRLTDVAAIAGTGDHPGAEHRAAAANLRRSHPGPADRLEPLQ